MEYTKETGWPTMTSPATDSFTCECSEEEKQERYAAEKKAGHTGYSGCAGCGKRRCPACGYHLCTDWDEEQLKEIFGNV